MPRCPSCHDEYEDGMLTCATCHLDLVADDVDLAPQLDSLLGTFHPMVVPMLTALLSSRRLAHDVVTTDMRAEVLIDRAHRDDLRAELIVNWSGLIGRLDLDSRAALFAAGGQQPGWFDAPTSSWVDRDGRLQVDPGGDEEEMAEASRLWGPTLVALGAVTGLFGWYGQSSAALLVVGLTVAGVGLLLPR